MITGIREDKHLSTQLTAYQPNTNHNNEIKDKSMRL